MHTQFANIATPTEVVVATSFTIDLGNGGADFHVCMPYAMLEPIRKMLYSGLQADRSDSDNRWLLHLTDQIDDAEVELVADLGQATLRMHELLQIQPGDIIPFDLPQSVIAQVDGVPVLECTYGVTNGRYALQVQHTAAFDAAESRAGPGPAGALDPGS
jgi:flagellar motor switch protein FliM